MAGIDSDLIRGHIDTIILNILGEGDRYGYEICKEVENKSGGAYELKQPTLYSCLKRLESQGLISSYWEDSDIGGKRHYYKLTEQGQATYQQNQADWRRSKQIIDNLISTDDTAPITGDNALPNNAEKDNATENNDADTNGVLPGQTAFIFEEIDKEVEAQDKGEALDDDAILAPENKAAKNGLETVDDETLPFDNNDYSSFCTHLVKNSETISESDKNELTSTNAKNENDADELESDNASNSDAEADDILALLGHYNVEEKSVKTETENSSNEVQQPENEFLAKFITGKYSEYNPNKNDYLEKSNRELADANCDEDNNQTEHEQTVQEEDENEHLISNSNEFNDDAEFGDDEFSPKMSSFFSSPDASKSDNDDDDSVTTFTFNDEKTLNNLDAPLTSQGNEENKPNDNLYNDITYFNLNSNNSEDISKVSSSDLFNGFAQKFDADTSLIKGESDDSSRDNEGDDEIALDLSKPVNSDDIAMDFSVSDGNNTDDSYYDNKSNNGFEDVQNANEDQVDYSSFMAELEENEIDVKDVKPFKNNIDLTSVYDKTGNGPISATYIDKDAKAKLNELAGSSINSDFLNSGNQYESQNIIDPIPIEQIRKSNENSPKDLSNLKADLQIEGISVRPYYKTVKEPASSKTFIETNKIKMVRNWIVFFIQILLLGATFFATYKLNIGEKTFMGSYIYYVCGLCAVFALAVFSTIKYWVNPFKKVTAKYAPRISHLFALLFTVQFIVIIYCVNLQLGFYSFTQIDYNHLNWIVPCVVSLTPIVGSVVYEILYKSKNFHI